MKVTNKIALAMTLFAASCTTAQKNPLLSDFDTPYGVPPFDKIKTEHFMPAFDAAIAEARAEVDAIANSTEAPTFENTIEALESAGGRLNVVSTVFFNLEHSETNEQMQQIAVDVTPKLTEYGNDVSLNPKIFERVKAVYDKRESLNLDKEQMMLLENTYKGFARNGAALSDADKDTYRKLSTELSNIGVKFGQNVLAATNAFSLHITDSTDLAGLPPTAVNAAREEAKSRNLEGWVVTLHAPSMIPFMQYADKRELREKVWRAQSTRAIGGENNNLDNVKRMAELRLQIANLLGYPTYADYVLEERMAGSSKAVNDFLNTLADKSVPAARRDYDMINKFAKENGLQGEVMPWDFGYYQTKYKDTHFNLNDEMTRPYFKLENAEAAIFMLANKLYGITFEENKSLPVYHPDVRGFEVKDTDGSLLAVLYIDYFPRPTKSGGAWMTAFREQYVSPDGKNVRPIVALNCNFTKPTADAPSLLTYDEVNTLLHEFGHGLHGIFANSKYESLSGTSVRRDFVELPSQRMEKWLPEREFLDLWAVHYRTGEKMPQELVDKIVAAQRYLAGYLSSRQLGYGLADMAWHSITEPVNGSVADFERAATDKIRVLPSVEGTSFSPSFSHIFDGGYAAGYYSYKWAEVLDADAYSEFTENGIFDRATAQSFRDNILSKGGTEEPMELYKRFRGQEPTADAMLKRDGLID